MEFNPLALDQYVLRRKVFKIFGGHFDLLDTNGNKLLFSRQKAFKLKEDIRLFLTDQPHVELLTIKARSIIDFGAAYDVIDTRQGMKVGALRRKGFSSLIRDSWQILDANDVPIGKVTEDSTGLALLRRFLTNLIPQTFNAYVGDLHVAEFSQRFNPFIYKLDIDFRFHGGEHLDRRRGLAAAILLCAIEGRQD
jgi:hypothetical protein